MKILFISNEYPPETGFGGIGTYTKYTAECMAERGHFVSVICMTSSKESFEYEQNSVRIYRVPSTSYSLPTSKWMYPFRRLCYRYAPHLLLRLSWAKAAFKKYLELCSKGISFDIIEFPECGSEGFYFRNIANLATIARLHTPWNLVRRFNSTKDAIADNFLLPYLEKKTVLDSVAVSSPSATLAKMVKQQWKVKEVAIYPNPIPLKKYPQTFGSDWIFTGRVEHRKGVHILLEAYAILKAEMQVPKLWLIGRPYGKINNGKDYGEYIYELISRLGLTKSVEWIKGIDHDSISGYLKKSSVAIFPSLWDNFPYSCLEAMASGCAVVASRCGGFVEMIEDQVSGFLFEPANTFELKEILKKLNKNSQLCLTIGENARKKVAISYDSDALSATIEKFYLSVLSNRIV